MNRYKFANDALHVPKELARTVSKQKKRRSLRLGATAIATAAAILAGIFLWPASVPEEKPNNFPLSNPLVSTASAAEVLAAPEYPEMVQAPNPDEWDPEAEALWQESRSERWKLRPEDDSALYDFYDETAREFLLNADGENILYSPLNLYMALGMLAEVTDGNSREQILNLLNCDTVEELRAFIRALWNVNYWDDGAVTSLLASSLWLRDDTNYNMDTMQTLSDSYYASSHRGTMGSAEYNRMFREWMNENTGGLLSDQIEGLELDADTVLALASTIYFKAAWEQEFSPSETVPDIFHGPDGDVTVDFLNNAADQEYYWAEDFAAVELPLANSGSMWIFLPDEGKTVADLLDGSALELIHNPYDWENRTYIQVDLSIPKFDVSSQLDLNAGLKNLGVADVFSWITSDFSPVCEDSELIYLSQATHGARVMIDEQGCTGAAFTVMPMLSAAIPPEDIAVFKADRPFLFAITGIDNQILFMGVVNQP